MKTKTQKRMLTKLTIVLMLAILFGASNKLSAQCLANYTFAVDPANNGDVNFTNTSIGGTGLFYTWNFGDGNYSTLQNPGLHNYAASGTYSACLTVYDSVGMFDSTLGCYTTFCNTITVINPTGSGSSCNASFVGYDSLGSGMFYNTSTGTGILSTWDFGDGSNATSTGDVVHPYSVSGTYYVCLSISNFLGTCTDTYCDSIHINAATSGACMGVVNPTFTYTDSSGYLVFHNTVSGTGPVYHWDFGDGSTSADVGNTTHAYAVNGMYQVCLTVYETGTGTDSCQYCSYVSIGSVYTCSANFSIIQDSTNLFNYYIYQNFMLSGSATYFWDFGDGTTSTLQFPSHTYATSTPTYLCLTITDGPSCTATYCDSINPGHAASSTFTINVVNPLGVEEQSNNIASLENYPNPFGEHTTIAYSIKQSGNVVLSIYDLLGNKVAEIENGNKASGEYTTIWNAQSISEGMYLLQLKVGNNVSTKKIIVNK